MDVVSPTPTQVEEALTLLVAQQVDPATATAYLGRTREGVAAELADQDQPWPQTARVAVRDGAVVGVASVEWDEEVGRAWIMGPWAADAEAWAASARALVEAMIAQTPSSIADHEISSAPANVRMATLAETLGWKRGAVNYAYVARSADGWPADDERVRPATTDDLTWLGPLHEQAFPATYNTARQLVEDDELLTLVLDDGSGYASGRVQPDGDGYLDFIAIVPEARGQGLAVPLLARIGRALIERSPHHNVNLTVLESNAAAVRLYEGFGFERDEELVGYRSVPYRRE